MSAIIRTVMDADERRILLPELARLRIAVFREWPYLYDGSEAYEAAYLEEFMAEAGSVLIIAEAEGQVVGAATASPMSGQKAAFHDPFAERGMDVDRLFYFGESVLLSSYRGLGIGHGFFDAREKAAREAGAAAACFCAVVRPDTHPLRPATPRNLHSFWRAREYAPIDGLTCTFQWKDVDQVEETSHSMQFWMRQL